jgi:hypothetical protein
VNHPHTLFKKIVSYRPGKDRDRPVELKGFQVVVAVRVDGAVDILVRCEVIKVSSKAYGCLKL